MAASRSPCPVFVPRTGQGAEINPLPDVDPSPRPEFRYSLTAPARPAHPGTRNLSPPTPSPITAPSPISCGGPLPGKPPVPAPCDRVPVGIYGDPVLWERFRAWITLVLAQQVGLTGSDLEFMLRNEEEGEMTTLIERSREWGEALNQQRLEKGIKKGERELVLRMVARRFGSAAADDLVPVLAGISDSDRIAAIAAKVFEFETADELVEWVRAT